MLTLPQAYEMKVMGNGTGVVGVIKFAYDNNETEFFSIVLVVFLRIQLTKLFR